MYTAIIVGFILAVLWFIEKVGGTPMVIRPIVVCPIVGLALGDLKTGLLIGATLELVFMGAISRVRTWNCICNYEWTRC